MKKWNVFTLPLIPLVTLLLATSCTSSPHKPQSAWLKSWRAQNPTWRGVHLSLGSDAQATALGEQLPRLKALGVNILIVEVNYSYDFQSHPELRGGQFLTRSAARTLVGQCRTNGIRLIPQLNCLGHQSWAKVTAPLLTKYPEFDETPGQYPENKGIYCRSWCPQHPQVNKVVFALIDELVEVFEADAFHVGMDEVFLLASEFCPRCRGGDPAKLFAKAVTDLHGHIVKDRKLEMLMWGDRLLDAQALKYSEWEASKNKTWPAVDLVPKDIIICDWHYLKQTVYPSVPFLLEKGFRVWPSGWQPLEANIAFSEFAKQQKNPRMLGYLCTTWGRARIPQMADWPPITEVLPTWK